VEAIKIGWLGSALDGPGGGYDKIHRLAFDEAAEAGLLDRPVEFVLHPENGLPQGSAKNATDGFKFLVDEGCIGVAGAYSSDNAITVGRTSCRSRSSAGAEPNASRASTASDSATATAVATPRSWSRGSNGTGTRASRC
jgi:hypothetical protein